MNFDYLLEALGLFAGLDRFEKLAYSSGVLLGGIPSKMQVRRVAKIQVESDLPPNVTGSFLQSGERPVYLILSSTHQHEDLCIAKIACHFDVRYSYQTKTRVIEFEPDDLSDLLFQCLCQTLRPTHNLCLELGRRDLLDHEGLDLILDLDVVEVD